MEESVALSSIDIQISSIRPAPIHTVQRWNIGDVINNAFEMLLEAGKSIIEFLINFIIVIVPILILIAIPIVLIVFMIRKSIRKKTTRKSVSENKEADKDILSEVDKK